MAPKNKGVDAPTAKKKDTAKDKAKGGRPSTAAQLAKVAATTRFDGSIAQMFGARAAPVPKTPPTFVADLMKWNFTGIGGEEVVGRSPSPPPPPPPRPPSLPAATPP